VAGSQGNDCQDKKHIKLLTSFTSPLHSLLFISRDKKTLQDSQMRNRPRKRRKEGQFGQVAEATTFLLQTTDACISSLDIDEEKRKPFDVIGGFFLLS
jgi:hypothetical protein